ncbi:MAG: hypothetical protein Alis3KO_30210 [Aliiglaciecola sp.]
MNAPKLHGEFSVTAQVEVTASQHEVWQVISDYPNVSKWAPSVEKSYATTDAHSGLGAGRYCKLDGFGEIEEYITVWQEGTGFVYDVTPLGPLDRSFSSWWLEALDEKRTLLTVVLSYDIRYGLFGRLMHKFVMRPKLEGSFPNSLQVLKSYVEKKQVIASDVAENQPV